MKVKVVDLIFALSLTFGLFLSTSLTLHKFKLAEQNNFAISFDLSDGFNYGQIDEDLVLYNDEIKYLTWLIFRSESISKLSSIEGIANLNLYGFFVSSVFIFTGEWKVLFIIGFLSYLYFVFTIKNISFHLLGDRISKLMSSCFCLLPPVIDLSSGFMRDLLLISFVLQSLFQLSNKRYFSFLVFFFLVFSLRSFYVIILSPFVFYVKTRNFRYSIFFMIFSISFSMLILRLYKFGNGSVIEVIYRFIELLTGASKVLIYDFSFPFISAGSFEFYSALVYFFVPFLLYFLFVVNRFLVDKLFFLLFLGGLNLSIFYGYTLGFFVPRTKLVFIVGVIFFIFYSLHKREFSRSGGGFK
ncbi:hypothetical protein [Pseudoalteromonas sp. T1lg10]|uniref:hypothetical protein n=1 Tax=Pseudoalteromonas sp. T1lg10 TaxID=2077093 RepID=UPI000CF609C6|nr:hypothetical protein [Pseudoalteromonas sp. T1lg10]